MFDHKKYLAQFLAQPNTNDAKKYGISVRTSEAELGYRVIGIHHLLPEENEGKHNAYLDVLDEQGNRLNPPPLVAWTWDGRQVHEVANPVVLDKPLNETGGNIAIEKGQVISLWVMGASSDVVSGIHTAHPDEPTGDGKLLNTIGHHSFYIVFQRCNKVADTDIPPHEPEITSPSLIERIERLEAAVTLIGKEVARIRKTVR